MADAPLSLNIEYFPDPAKGIPISSGDVYVGQPDTDPEILGNRVNVTIIQEDGRRVIIEPASQPLQTGGGGVILYQGSPVVVLVDGTVSVKVLDSLGSQKYYVPFANEVAEAEANEGVLIPGGSFENETQFSGLPDNWDISESATGTIAIDTANQVHGIKSLKFTSVDSSGAGTATTSAKFNVLEGGDVDYRFSYVSSAVDTLNKVQVKYYDATGSAVTTRTIYSEGAANPLVWASVLVRDTAPATAVQAELILTGADGAGTTVIGTTNFDNVSATPITENAIVRTEDAANSVNKLQVTSSATGDPVLIEPIGDDANIDLNVKGKGTGGTGIDKVVDSNGNEVTIFEEVASAVNEVKITNAASGNTPLIRQTGVDDVGLTIEDVKFHNGEVNDYPYYSLIVLDTPEILSTATTSGSWVTVNSATLNTAQAKKAIVRISVEAGDLVGTNGSIRIYTRKTGSGLANDLSTIIAGSFEYVNTGTSINVIAVGETTVNLDASYDFDYYVDKAGNLTNAVNFSINLVGYYV